MNHETQFADLGEVRPGAFIASIGDDTWHECAWYEETGILLFVVLVVTLAAAAGIYGQEIAAFVRSLV